jgi:hypothetical protein
LKEKEQKEAFSMLKNMGNFRHNIGVLENGKGQLIVKRRSAKYASVDDYLPCIYCVHGNTGKTPAPLWNS